MIALLLVAASLGLSNFAAAIAIGVSGVDARTRLRVGVVFGLFEAGMPLLGLLLGHGLVRTLGHSARWIGAVLLIATGLYTLIHACHHHGGGTTGTAVQALGKLLVSGLALSIDNLAVGFALGTYHVALLTAAVLIGAVSVTMALAGLELGRLLGTKIGERGRLSVASCWSVSASSSQADSSRSIGAQQTASSSREAARPPRPQYTELIFCLCDIQP